MATPKLGGQRLLLCSRRHQLAPDTKSPICPTGHISRLQFLRPRALWRRQASPMSQSLFRQECAAIATPIWHQSGCRALCCPAPHRQLRAAAIANAAENCGLRRARCPGVQNLLAHDVMVADMLVTLGDAAAESSATTIAAALIVGTDPILRRLNISRQSARRRT
jgi:hypothetical protein